jgi:hypothetical protein
MGLPLKIFAIQVAAKSLGPDGRGVTGAEAERRRIASLVVTVAADAGSTFASHGYL